MRLLALRLLGSRGRGSEPKLELALIPMDATVISEDDDEMVIQVAIPKSRSLIEYEFGIQAAVEEARQLALDRLGAASSGKGFGKSMADTPRDPEG